MPGLPGEPRNGKEIRYPVSIKLLPLQPHDFVTSNDLKLKSRTISELQETCVYAKAAMQWKNLFQGTVDNSTAM